MKIILINNLYAPWVRGGAERVVEKTAAGLEKAGHDVFIITTAPKESRTDCIRYLPSIFYNLDKYPQWLRFFWHLWDIFNFLSCFKIKNILAEKNPDLVITHNLQGVNLLLPRLLRKLKIKHIHTLHDIQLLHPSGLMLWGKEKIIDSLPAKIYQALTRKLMGSPAVVVSPSKWLLAEYEKRGFFKKSEKKVLQNYFSKQRLVKDTKYQIPNTKYQFLYVGLIESHKGIKFFCEAFGDFLKANINVRVELSVVGGGAQLEELKGLAGDQKEIHVLGRKNESEIEELMLSSDCLVVPSFCYENSPTVIYEAIAAGLPVLGANLGGIPELIKAAGGILFEPGNKEDLLKNVAEIISTPEKLYQIRIKEKTYHSFNYISELIRLANEVKNV
jgi:glycosyltransferase involved in cell wall biosynthesis